MCRKERIKFKYRKKYDATPIRQSLGLDGGRPLDIEQFGGEEELLRVVNFLNRTKKIKRKELENLGFIINRLPKRKK